MENSRCEEKKGEEEIVTVGTRMRQIIYSRSRQDNNLGVPSSSSLEPRKP